MHPIPGTETIVMLLPELVLLLGAVYLYVAGTFLSGRLGWTFFAVACVGIAMVALWRQQAVWIGEGLLAGDPVAAGPILVDWLGEAMRHLALVTCALWLAAMYAAPRRAQTAEYAATMLLATVGWMVVARANDLVLLFVGLELISIPTYVLVCLGGRGVRGLEATAKYFFLSIASSAIVLYGFAMVYGLAGTTVLVDLAGETGITTAWDHGQYGLGVFATVLVLVGIGFKLTAFPSHFYAPDVYEGAGWAGAAFLATVPKAAAVVVLIRLFGYGHGEAPDYVWQLMAVLAAVTMTLGNTAALWQKDIRRLLGYSSIAHAGYLLLGLVAMMAAELPTDFGGGGAMLFYTGVYVLATMLVFAVLVAADLWGWTEGRIADLAGFARRHPVAGLLLAVGLFSLAGIPPLAGFWGKLGLFVSLVQVVGAAESPQVPDAVAVWLVPLLVLAAVNAAIGAAYYLRILGVVYFGDPVHGPEDEGERAWLPLVSACVAGWLVVSIGLMPAGLLARATRAEQMLVPPVRLETLAPSDSTRSAAASAPADRDGQPQRP